MLSIFQIHWMGSPILPRTTQFSSKRAKDIACAGDRWHNGEKYGITPAESSQHMSFLRGYGSNVS